MCVSVSYSWTYGKGTNGQREAAFLCVFLTRSILCVCVRVCEIVKEDKEEEMACFPFLVCD